MYVVNVLAKDILYHISGADPKLEKNMFFLRKIVIFHTKYPKNVRASLRNWKKYDFLAYNRDFSHEIPPLIFAPPSARRNFF